MVDFTRLMFWLVNKKTYVPFLLVTIADVHLQIINMVSTLASAGYQRTVSRRE